MVHAKNSGQLEGWIEILDKLAKVVVVGLAQANKEVEVLMIVMREIQLRLAAEVLG